MQLALQAQRPGLSKVYEEHESDGNEMATGCIDRHAAFFFLSQSLGTLSRLAFPEWPTDDMSEHQLETIMDRREDMVNITTRTTLGSPIDSTIAFVWKNFVPTEPAISHFS